MRWDDEKIDDVDEEKLVEEEDEENAEGPVVAVDVEEVGEEAEGSVVVVDVVEKVGAVERSGETEIDAC